MKKKMLQRSLALGALIAFVITGSAMAAGLYAKGETNSNDITISQIGRGARIGIQSTYGLTTQYLGSNINIDVESTTANAYGISSKGNTSERNILYLGGDNTNNISINVSNSAAYTVGKENGNSRGLMVVRNKTNVVPGPLVIVTTDNLTIDVSSQYGYAEGINVSNMTTNTEYQPAEVIINARNTNIKVTGNDTYKGTGIVAYSQGKIDINGNLSITADNIISTRGQSVVNINEDGTGTVKLDGNIDFNYDEKTSKTKVDSDVSINLTGANSYWNGNAAVTWDTGSIPEGKEKVTGLDLILADGAQWNPTAIEDTDEGVSGVTSIAINQLTANDGIINVKDGAKARIGEMLGTGADINVETLAAAQVEIATKAADTKLSVNAGADITDKLASGEANVDETAKIIAFSEDSESSDYVFTSAESDVAGAMTLQVEDGEVVKDSFKEAVNSSNAGISNMGSIALMTWRQENNDMNKRLGELRDSAGEHGVWVRMTRGEGKYKSIKNQYNSYQIGYDEKLSVNKNWTVGAALTYTDGESSFAQGNGENTHKGFAVYGSYLNDDGSFIDLIAKYSRLEHEFETVGGAGKGDYETNGYSVSAEYGKRFTKDNGWWIEPQVELTYGKVGSANYLTSKGVMVRQDGMDSLVGRLGFALGKDLAKDKGNVYLRASYLYDFDGETDMSFTNIKGVSRTIEQDLGGGWWEVGVGANVNLSEASHLYFDVEKTYGGDVATPWQWNAGVRWSF